MKFRTNYENRPIGIAEKQGGKTQVEVAGYIPAKKRIENMILAGQRLVDYRKATYDLTNGEDDGDIDPTRNRAFDLADATTLHRDVEAKLRAQQEKASQTPSISQKEGGSEVNPTSDLKKSDDSVSGK